MTRAPRRPLFLTLLAVVFFGHAFILPVLAIVFLGANPGTKITINGEPALLGNHRGEMLLTMLVWWLIAFATAKGIWNRNPWARHGIAAVLLVTYVGGALLGLYLRDAAMSVGSAAFALLIWWYFYRKESVTTYFSSRRPAVSDKDFDSSVSDEVDRILERKVKDT